MAGQPRYNHDRTLTLATRMARERGSYYATPEHLLLALLRSEEQTRQFIVKFGVNINTLEISLNAKAKESAPATVNYSGYGRDSDFSFKGLNSDCKRIVQRYQDRVQNFEKDKDNYIRLYGREYVPGPVDFLMSLLDEDCDARNILKAAGMSSGDAHGEYKKYVENGGKVGGPYIVTSAPVLAEFGENLNLKAFQGKIEPVIGREAEIDRIIEILCRVEKSNPMLTGIAGVGKTAIVEGLARRISDGHVPEKLKNKNIFTMDLGAVVAGTKYRGQFEERMKAVLKEIKSDPNIIIFLDEMHTMVGAGAAEGSLDAAEMMKTGLARGEIRCIGATDDDHIDIIEKDTALMRRFQTLHIKEPDFDSTIKILQGRKTRYEQAYGITIPDNLLAVIADLSSRYVTGRASPDKDLDNMDETGARLYLNRKEGATPVMSVADVELTAAKMAGLKSETVCADGARMVRGLEDKLKKLVVNQDHAVEALVRVVKRSRAGMADPRRPIGSFVFTGPTGVGKTELAEALAEETGVPLIRINMSEYQNEESVKKFYGSDPGYVGYDDTKTLTDKVRRNSHCVILLDEIEKAHPDVFQSLLQILDKGLMTDNKGREVKFKNTILIMTANIRKDTLKPTPGFQTAVLQTGNDGLMNRKSTEIANVFSPEFRNRLDDVIEFRALEKPHMVSIADKFMDQVRARVSRRDIDISMDDAAREYLARNGHDAAMGARPLNRLIEREVIDAMVDEVIFGKLKNGGSVLFTCKSDGSGEEKLSCLFNEKAADKKKPEAARIPSAPQGPAPL